MTDQTAKIIIPCTPLEKSAAVHAAQGQKFADWALAWIRNGSSLPETSEAPRWLIADGDDGDIYALHAHRPRMLFRVLETARGPIAQPLESYEPTSTAGGELSKLIREAQDAVAAWMEESD